MQVNRKRNVARCQGNRISRQRYKMLRLVFIFIIYFRTIKKTRGTALIKYGEYMQ